MPDFLQSMCEHVALDSVRVSAAGLDGRLGRGLRAAVADIDLETFNNVEGWGGCGDLIECITEGVQRGLPRGARHWAVARHSVNVFLQQCARNVFLRQAFALEVVEHELELPINARTDQLLKRNRPSRPLAAWPGLTHLTEQHNQAYQAQAAELAQRWQTPRVHLDVYSG